MQKFKIGFICVHNSCRSQMAEALSKLFAEDIFESYSAGTELVPHINKQAVRIIKEKYNYDMSNQYSKLIKDLPELDIVITMGCNVECPYVKCKYRADWGLEDPTGKSDDEFIKVAKIIEQNILDLSNKINSKEIFFEEE